MTEESCIADRVNALIRPENSQATGRRRRSFVAAPISETAYADTVPTLTGEEDDLPVLTEIVAEEETVSEKGPDLDSEARVSALASEMALAIGQQMAFELPTLIEATLINASEELRIGIISTMETALRDFVAHRKQLRLPLDESVGP